MRDVRDAVTSPLRNAPRGVTALARIGFAAKGAVYLLIGGLTAGAAFGATRTRVTDTHGAFASILRMPFGQVVLAVMAVGLFGYAAWRILSALRDGESRGTSAKGLALRVGDLGKAAVHIAIGFAALRLVNGATRRGSGGDAEMRDWTATLLDAPAGTALVIGAGAVLLVFAALQVWRAWSGRFLQRLALTAASRPWVERAGRFGLTARAVVFALIGVFVIRAATNANPAEAKGFGSALRSLEAQPYGPWILGAVALGLAGYGLFELAEARFRRIRAA